MISKPNTCQACPLWSVTHFQKGKLVTNTGTGWVNPQGMPNLGLTFVGEAAGLNEEQAGLPFRSDAQAGSILERVFRRARIDRTQVRIGNILSCRPPNNELSGKSWEVPAISNCAPHREKLLAESLAYVQSMNTPKVFNPFTPMAEGQLGSIPTNAPKQHVTVALGGTAFRTLTGLAGDKLSIERARGYPVMTQAYGLVIGTYHPAFVARKRKFFGVLLEDVMTAQRWARDGFTEHPRDYITHPSPAQIQAFVNQVLGDPSLVLSWDIETDMNWNFDTAVKGTWPRIKSVQFSIKSGTGIFIEASQENLEAIRVLLSSPNVKLGHNIWDFDCQVVRYWGFKINGLLHDTLWMFHHYQPDITIEDMSGQTDSEDDFRLSTSAGLQYTASFCGMDFLWKHYNQTNPEFYGIADVDACSRIWATLPQKMKNLGVWDGYVRHVMTMKPILDAAAERGLWLDLDGRDKLHTELTQITVDLDGVMQGHHPDEIKRLDPVNGFVREPQVGDKVRATAEGYEWLDDSAVEEGEDPDPDMPLIAGVWRPMVQRLFKVQVKTHVKQCECVQWLVGEPRFGKKGQPLKPKPQATYLANCQLCKGAGSYYVVKDEVVKRWARLMPFKPSNKQLITYMKHAGHKVPHDRKTDKDTTNKDKIAELAKSTKDPLYQTVLDIRTVQKMDSTYVTGRWIPSKTFTADYDGVSRPIGLIQTKFTTAPATGQKSSRDPNIQNAPKHIRNKNLRKLDLPTRFRSLIVAPPGHKIVEFDFKSAHALTLGFEAECIDYMRLARLDVHSYMASVLLSQRGVIKEPLPLGVSDADLKLMLEDIKGSKYLKLNNIWQRATDDLLKAYPEGELLMAKEVRDTQAKPAILGYGFGLQGLHLWEMNKDSFANQFEAQEVLGLIDKSFPQLKAYRDRMAMLAHDQKYLVTRGGAVRWFWDVFHFKYNPEDPKKWKVSHGSDYEDAIALGPANDAFVHIDEAMIVLDERDLLRQYNFINTVHDSLIFYLALRGLEEAMQDIVSVMEAPSKILVNQVCPTGLAIGVDYKMGNNWGEIH